MRWVFDAILAVVASAGFHASADARDDAASRVVVQVIETETGGAAYQVDMTLLTGGEPSRFILRDMSYSAPNCPHNIYRFDAFENARPLDLDMTDDRTIQLERVGPGPISISYRVTTELRHQDLTVPAVNGCNILLSTPGGVFVDGAALLLAPRSPDGWPRYRVGRTILRFEGNSPNAVTVSSLSGRGGAEWEVPRFDDLRFAFFATGSFAIDRATDASAIRVFGPDINIETGQRLGRAGGRLIPHLSQQWGEPGFEGYSAFMIGTTGRDGDLAESSGMARPAAHVVFHGPAMDEHWLLVMFAHEVVHSWIPSRFGRLEEGADWRWLREGLTDYLTHKTLLDLDLAGSDHFVDRLNVALQNMALGHTPELKDYDEGFVLFAALDAIAGLHGHTAAVDDLVRHLMQRDGAMLTPAAFWRAVENLGMWPALAGGFSAERDLPCTYDLGRERYTLVEGRWPVYETGWSFSETEVGVIERVEPGSPADRAGVRINDRIVSIRSPGFGNIHRAVELSLARNSTVIRVVLLPRGDQRTQAYPQYVEDLIAVQSWADVEPSEHCRSE